MMRFAVVLLGVCIALACLKVWLSGPTDMSASLPGNHYTPERANGDSVEVKRGYGPKLLGHGEEGNELYNMDEQVLESEKIYVHGVLDSSTEWFGTGKLWSQTQYKNGKRHGIHKVYNKDGKTIDYIQYYENGERMKEWDSVSSMKKDPGNQQ